MNTELRELSIKDIEKIKSFFAAVFTKEPWNDDWSNEEQLHAYVMDLIGNRNSLTLGLFENDSMVEFPEVKSCKLFDFFKSVNKCISVNKKLS